MHRFGNTIWGATVLLVSASFLITACVTQDTALSARVQELQDEDEIRNVLLDYGRHLDSRNWEGYSQLFAEEGEWVGGFGTVQSPSGIQAFMEENMGNANPGNNYHLLSNFVIDVDGDRATAWSRWAFVTPGAGGGRGAAISQSGRYEDTLIRENGEWKFLHREALSDLP